MGGSRPRQGCEAGAVWCPFCLAVRWPRPGGAPAGGRAVLLLSVHRPGTDQDQAAQGEPVPALHAGTLGVASSPLKAASSVIAHPVRRRGTVNRVHHLLDCPPGPQLQALGLFSLQGRVNGNLLLHPRPPQRPLFRNTDTYSLSRRRHWTGHQKAPLTYQCLYLLRWISVSLSIKWE